MPDSFPWVLRLEHEGFASVRLERAGRHFRFDPVTPSETWAALGETPNARALHGDDVVVLTMCEHERLAGTAHALRDAIRPTVVAQPEVLDWLAQFGVVEGGPAPLVLDGVRVEALPFEPIAYAEGMEIAWKALSTVSDLRRSARRFVNRVRLPRAKPLVVELTLPDGRRFVHLNVSVHNDTPDSWLAEAAERFRGADWAMVGVDYGHEQGFLDRIGRFDVKKLLVTDLVSDVRRSMGMPTTVLTPLVDALRERGMDAYVFASRSSFRFE